MAIPSPTFYRLSQAADWRTGRVSMVSTGDALRLVARRDGPLALSAADGSLGGLVLPSGFAIDAKGQLVLLDARQAPLIKRYDTSKRRFVPLLLFAPDSASSLLARPTSIAIAADNLYVADPSAHRVHVFALASFTLRYAWGPCIDAAVHPDAPARDEWIPADVTAADGVAYVLDQRKGRVYRHVPGLDALELVLDEPLSRGRWTRIAVDRAGCLYLLAENPGADPVLEIFEKGRRVGSVADASDVRDRFAPVALRLDWAGRFCLPRSLARRCDRRPPSVSPPPEVPLQLCTGGDDAESLIFDRWGEPAKVEPYEPAGPQVYVAAGSWISEPLDGKRPRCQWDRIELEGVELPVGSRMCVSTYSDDRCLTDVGAVPVNAWMQAYTTVGKRKAPADRHVAVPPPHESLVQSREGRYLWLKIELSGDGFETPAIHAIKASYPRRSYLADLPAAYSFDEESRWFLERFLSVFQTEWDAIEGRIEEEPRYLDPAAVPTGPFLEYLAQWLGVNLEGDWDWEQKRQLLAAIPKIAGRRGTADGLRGLLQAYIYNIAGIAPSDQGDLPMVIEAFRERERLLVGVDGSSRLGQSGLLWGPSAVGRMQLGVYSRADEVRLISTGDPQRDLFHEHAHRFRVVVPSAWVPTAQAERMLRRAVDAEKPAHTTYDLCLVEPRFRVGIQSTVGVDTVLGSYFRTSLACRHDCDVPPSRPPHGLLGYDIVLATRPQPQGGLALQPPLRVGIDTRLS
ncbi:MAG: hypothetical protein HY270_18420 [Deltaproteobacteria bacterium]|nr:hypothetical protein [Deltaproteobacteria bacterium]